jgi:hypothetical protein
VFDAAKQRQVESARRFMVIPRMGYPLYVDGCPKPEAKKSQGKPFAYVTWDCWHCEFLVENGVSRKIYDLAYSNDVLSEEARQSFLNDPEPEGYILCGWPKITKYPDVPIKLGK